MFIIYLSVNALCHALLVPPLDVIVGRETVCCLSLNKPFVVVVLIIQRLKELDFFYPIWYLPFNLLQYTTDNGTNEFPDDSAAGGNKTP